MSYPVCECQPRLHHPLIYKSLTPTLRTLDTVYIDTSILDAMEVAVSLYLINTRIVPSKVKDKHQSI